MDGERRVRKLLTELHEIKERQYYKGDYGAVTELADFQAVLKRADLTKRQREVIRLVYEEDLSQAEASRRLGIHQPNISIYIDHAIKKIAKIYQQWEDTEDGT